MVFVWFDSLRPIKNLSVMFGRVFLCWTSTKLGLICLGILGQLWYLIVLIPDLCTLTTLLKDRTKWRRWGSNPWPLGFELSTLPLSHCAPHSLRWYLKKTSSKNKVSFLFYCLNCTCYNHLQKCNVSNLHLRRFHKYLQQVLLKMCHRFMNIH